MLTFNNGLKNVREWSFLKLETLMVEWQRQIIWYPMEWNVMKNVIWVSVDSSETRLITQISNKDVFYFCILHRDMKQKMVCIKFINKLGVYVHVSIYKILLKWKNIRFNYRSDFSFWNIRHYNEAQFHWSMLKMESVLIPVYFRTVNSISSWKGQGLRRVICWHRNLCFYTNSM